MITYEQWLEYSKNHGFIEMFIDDERFRGNRVTRVQKVKSVKKLFEMVYNWGVCGAVVDYKAPSFQRAIKNIVKQGYACPVSPLEAPSIDEECFICGELM